MNNVTPGGPRGCDDQASDQTDSKMIESGESVRPGLWKFTDEMIDELVRRADAGDDRALEALLELAETMLHEGALGAPGEPVRSPRDSH